MDKIKKTKLKQVKQEIKKKKYVYIIFIIIVNFWFI